MRFKTTLFAGALFLLTPIRIAFSAEPNTAQIDVFKVYLQKVTEAEAVADPIQRCLTYPDIPGLAWPKSHVEAHCHYHHEPVVSFKQMQEMVDAGKFEALEAAFDELQSRHLAHTNQSEIIHRAFERLEAADADKLTEAWLKSSPNSAYALTARADFLRGSAWRARGGKYVAETPKEDLKSMSVFAQQAIALYQTAIKRNPKLMQAYTGLINVAMMDSKSKIEMDAVTAGLASDNQCAELFRRTLIALRPRWGGSLDVMLGFQEKYVLPSITQRPLNAQYMGYAYEDAIFSAREENQTIEDLMPIALKGLALGAHEDLMDQVVRINRKLDRYDLQHIYTSQIIRFRGGTAIDYGNMGNIMLSFGFVEQGALFLQKALEIDPDNVYAHYRLASYYHFRQNWGKAISHAKLAKDHESYGKEAIRLLAESVYFDKRPLEALPYATEMTLRHPDAAESWGTRLMCEITLNRFKEADISLGKLKSLLKTDDKRYQSLIEVTEAALKRVK